MICCNPILQTFVNVPTVAVPYTGSKPVVSVTYLIDGVWQAAGVFTPITITDTQVIVDNSGNATGVVRLLQ